MCSGGSAPKPKPPPPPPPVQPPPVIEKAPEVKIGSQDEAVTKRRKIGRSQLRSASNNTTSKSSGLGA